MDLFNSSCQADEVCIIYCKAQANISMQCKNAVLVRLKNRNDHEHIVWMDEDAAERGIFSYVRAFYEPQEWAEDDLSDAVYRVILQPDSDVFCFNGNTYFLYAAQNHNDQIRRLKAYCSQAVVEAVEYQTFKHKVPQAVFLSNFYTFDGKRRNYALTCWGVSYEGETNYLPIFDEDRHYLEECTLSQFTREEVSVGDVFKNNGYYYKLLKGQNGKLELEQAKSVFLLGKADDYPPVEPVKTAKIISVNFSIKQQSGG